MTNNEILNFIEDNLVEVTPMAQLWLDKDGKRFCPKYHIVINGVSMAPMQLKEAVVYYVTEVTNGN